MKRFALTAAVALALAAQSAPSFAVGETTNEADVTVISTIAPASGVPLGKLIAMRINDPDLSEFKKAMETANIAKPFDVNKGYTVFAPINSEFSANEHPMEYYIINDRVSLATFPSKYDSVENIAGDDIAINRTANKSYFIDDERVNEVQHNGEGTVYKVGGFRDAPQL